MDKLIDFALKTLINSQPDLFGHGSKYLGYEFDTQYAPPSTVTSNTSFIRVKFKQNEQVILSSSLISITTNPTSPFEAIHHIGTVAHSEIFQGRRDS
ncbi:hypothetical protein V9T40_001888 [Parthenolecanium corni]|uniref:Uncharacterized protein n=1 Tax=Parthenolecanium corni TaxID=536013 RepID=A0AAN9THX1_9HEMI